MRPEVSIQPRVRTVAPLPTVELLGVQLAITDYQRTLDWIDSIVAARSRGYVCMCDLHTVIASRQDPELRAALMRSSLVLPVGQPLIWAIKALGHSVTAPLRPAELISRACARAVDSRQRFYLYGARNQGELVALALNLRQRYPGVKIVGGYCPRSRPPTEEEQVAVAEEISRSRADVVWVANQVPKQEKAIMRLRDRLEAPILIGVGAAFDAHAGLPGRRWRR